MEKVYGNGHETSWKEPSTLLDWAAFCKWEFERNKQKLWLYVLVYGSENDFISLFG